MRYIVCVLALCAGLAWAESCKVVGVSDGDTITCLSGNQAQFKVRLNQIDAPESTQAFGTQAKKSLSDMVFGKVVEIRSTGKDRYGRTLGELYIGNININKQMVAEGMAWVYREYLTDQEYLIAESGAKAQKLGLWSEPNPIYPSDFRRATKTARQNGTALPKSSAPAKSLVAPSSSSGSCARKTCKQISSCGEARHQLTVCGNRSLDRDNDGVPCESLCR